MSYWLIAAILMLPGAGIGGRIAPQHEAPPAQNAWAIDGGVTESDVPARVLFFQLGTASGNRFYQFQVHSDGFAMFVGERGTAHHGPQTFRVTPEQFEAFRAAVAPYHAAGDHMMQDDKLCGQLYNPDRRSFMVSWSTTDGPDQDFLSIDEGCDPTRYGEMLRVLSRVPKIFPQLAPLIGSKFTEH
jgi:hypothetical protein